jgi:hypothetical protein
VYISLCCLFALSTLNFAMLGQIDVGTTRDVQILILLTNVVIFLTMAVRGGLDYFGKRKAHEERKELMRLSQETKAKLDENTELTKDTTKNVRHDVRGEITAMSLVQQLEAQKLALKVEAENQAVRARMDELLKAFHDMQAGNGKAPQQVEVVNSPAHPVPVQSETPAFPQHQPGQQ